MGSKLVKFEVVRFPGVRVIGKTVRHPVVVAEDDPTATDLWARMETDGSLAGVR